MSAGGLLTSGNLLKAAPVALNFAILVGALYYFLKTPVITFIRTRHERMKSEIDAVREQLKAAQIKHQEYAAKLGDLESEIQSLRAAALEDAKQAQERIVKEAHRQAESILADAKQAASTLVADFKSSLAADFGHQVIYRAETMIKEQLKKEHQQNLRKDFAQQLEVAR